MEFYKSCLGGELILAAVQDTPAKERIPASQHDKILNARLTATGVDISASDWLRPDRTPVHGNTACLFQGGEVTDPLSQQFFGMYGALDDQFGVRWMFHTQAR
jgi:uncharacterized glyoxalase superfamily protein PhnB